MKPGPIRYRWKGFLLNLVVGGLVATAPAEGVDLLEVYDLATQDDPEMRRAQHEHRAASEILKQARAGFLPTLTVDAESGGTRQKIHSSDNPVFAEGTSFFATNRVTLTLNQPLYRHAAVVNLRQARTATRRADLAFETAKQELLLRVATLYFEALAAEATYDFAEAERTALQSHYEMTDLRRRTGLAAVTDLHEARARLAAVEALVIEAEDVWDDGLQALRGLNPRIPAGLSGLSGDLKLVPPAPDDAEAWKATALEENLRLLTQVQMVEVARQEVARHRAVRFPALDFLARGNRERNGGTLFGGGSDVETANFLVRLSVPVFEGGLMMSRVREAEQSYRAALEEFERQRREVVRTVRSSFYGVTRAISRSRALEQAVASQELALEARQEGYRSGRYSIVDVLDAERDLFEARSDYARARYDYVLNSLRLRQAVGALGEADLVTVNAWLE